MKLFEPQQRVLVQLNSWLKSNMPFCYLDGFPGVGKSHLVRSFLGAQNQLKILEVSLPEHGYRQAEFISGLIEEMEAKGYSSAKPKTDFGLVRDLLQEPVLLIIDEFQRCFGGEQVHPDWCKLLDSLSSRLNSRGRLLMISNRRPGGGKWLDACKHLTLSSPAPSEAMVYLNELLDEQSFGKERLEGQGHRAIGLLGQNPRAINILVAFLAMNPLSDLFGLEEASNAPQEISAAFLEDLERQLLRKILEKLEPPSLRELLAQLAIHRKPVTKEVFQQTPNGQPDVGELIRRFLVELDRKWYKLHPLVGQVVLSHKSPAQLIGLHAQAAPYYSRHFASERLVSPSLAADFSEACYHLGKGDQADELTRLTQRFDQHLCQRFTLFTPLANSDDELQERITLLSARLTSAGPEALEYHLARCLLQRGQDQDRQQALTHLRRACGPSTTFPGIWIPRLRLEFEYHGFEKGQQAIVAALEAIPTSANVYHEGAKLMAQDGKVSEAIALLQEGIKVIPATQGLFALYQACGELMARQGQPEEAIALLQEGIKVIPATQNLFALYQACGELMARQGQPEEAIALLQEGIKVSPIAALYQACGELMARQGQPGEAIKLLQQCIKVRPNAALYQSCGELMARQGQPEEAIALLQEGIKVIPATQSLFALYQACGELMARQGQPEEAIALLQEGIKVIPATQNLNTLYLELSKQYLQRQDPEAAWVCLMEGVRKLTPRQRWYLCTSAFLWCLAENALARCQDLLNHARIELSQFERTFARFVLLQLQGDYPAAAELDSDSFQSLGQKAFCLLCCGRPGEADQLLRSNRDLQLNQQPIAWLWALIADRLGDQAEVLRLTQLYLGRPLYPEERPGRDLLLALWDQPGSMVAFLHPRLPAAITGLADTIARQYFGPSVLGRDTLRIDSKAQVDDSSVAESDPIKDEIMTEGSKPATVFISYSHKDKAYKEKLVTHLSMLKRQSLIQVWHDREILGGEEWKNKIDDNLENADLILLLISANFVASDYCFELEMKRAMARHDAGEARVIPIIIRKVDWHAAPFGKLQPLPMDGKAVKSWSDEDEAFVDIARGIRRIITEPRAASKEALP